MNKLIVELDDSDLFIKLGVYCATNNMTKKAVVTQLLRELLEAQP